MAKLFQFPTLSRAALAAAALALGLGGVEAQAQWFRGPSQPVPVEPVVAEILNAPPFLDEPAFADVGLVAPLDLSDPAADFVMPTEAEIAVEFRPRVLNARARLQCVPFAREASGVELRGDARTWWAQAQGKFATSGAPQEGAVIVMRGYNRADRGHVAVVRKVVNPRKIIIDHANWLNRGEVTVNVPVWDVSKAGDWSEVRVWHVPGAHWGKRIYGALGFILPVRLDGGVELDLAKADLPKDAPVF